jgi:hypothetical protein
MSGATDRALRIAGVVAAALGLALAFAFFFEVSALTSRWPWPDSALSYKFIGSYIGGGACALGWIAAAGEWGAAAGFALNLTIIGLGSGAFLGLTAADDPKRGLWPNAIASAVTGILALAAFVWSVRRPIRDKRAMPPLVKISFVIFILVLGSTSLKLLTRAPVVFPWSLDPDSSVLFGIFFGASAAYYSYGLLRPSWHNAKDKLLAFLVYDLFLFPPYLALLGKVDPAYKTNLVIYVVVLSYSTAVSIYYLFVARETRRAWFRSVD